MDSQRFSYAIDRYTNEAGRLYGVLDKRLGEVEYVAGDYSIADIAIFPRLISYERQGQDLADYPQVQRWFNAIQARPAVEKGLALLREERERVKMDAAAREVMFGGKQYEKR